MAEQWRPIPGYENYYEASDLGHIRGLDRIVRQGNRGMRIRGRTLIPSIDSTTHYPQVRLCKDGERRNYWVHRLVLMAFRGEPAPGEECCHNNGVRTDNRLQNLRWDDHTANIGDAIAHGTFRSVSVYNGDKTHCHRGHPFDEANTFYRPTGGRSCIECRRLNERVRYHRNKSLLK